MKTLLSIALTLSSFTLLAETHHIEIIKFKFLPSNIIIQAGDTIIWTNKEKRQYHSVWFKTTEPQEPDYFFPDETFQKTFENTGDFSYECGPHPKMKGSVKVIEKP